MKRRFESPDRQLWNGPSLSRVVSAISLRTIKHINNDAAPDNPVTHGESGAHAQSDSAIGHTALKSEIQDKLKVTVPTTMISANEFTDWANGYGFGYGKRGTYHTENREAYVYIKRCLNLKNEKDVTPALAMARHLTAAGVLHPDTQWGTFKRSDDDFQLFPVSPGIAPLMLNDLFADEGSETDKFPAFRMPANEEGSYLMDLCHRVDPHYTPSTYAPWDETPPEGSLVNLLNTHEASHRENWGYDDASRRFYPVDVEVIDLSNNVDLIHSWYAAQQGER